MLLEEMLCIVVSGRLVHLGFPATAMSSNAVELSTHGICWPWDLDGLAILNEELGKLVLLEASHNTISTWLE